MSISINQKEVETTTLIDSTDANNIYVGEAKIGSSKSSANWQISKLVKNGTNFKVQFANSNLRFNNIWDDRTTIPYG